MNRDKNRRQKALTLAIASVIGVGAVSSSAFLSGCAMGRGQASQGGKRQDVKLNASSQVPAADGRVLLSREDNNNTALNVEVKHLAAPQKVDPAANSYVVWSRNHKADAYPQPLGALSVDQNLNGRLRTVTTQRNFDIFITAEPSSQVTEPSGDRLMWTTVDLD